MNLNTWTGSALYTNQLSRSDWQATWPKGYEVSGAAHTTSLTATAAMIKELTNDVYTTEGATATETKWGQNTGLTIGTMKGASYDDERWDALLSTITVEEAINFFCNSQNQTPAIDSIGLAMQHVQDGPLGFCYQTLGKFNENEEGDPTAMAEDDANAGYSINDSVTEPVLAASFNQDLLEEQGELFGTDSLWCNSTILWGPGLNTHRTPYNGRNHEYYSEDSMLTNYMGAAIVKGALKYGCVLAPKHFAFNDQETNRTGVSVFMNEQRAREIELRAFQGAFDDAGCMGTMTAFNRVGMRYASANKGLMTNILKGEWGFTGYIVTDMINGPLYMRADTSLMAGTTCLDTSLNKDSVALMNAIKDDPAALYALKEAMHSNLWVLANSNALNGINNLSKVISVTPWWKATLIAVDVVFGVLAVAALAGYVAVTILKKNDVEE
jgi:beta-glucosidase